MAERNLEYYLLNGGLGGLIFVGSFSGKIKSAHYEVQELHRSREQTRAKVSLYHPATTERLGSTRMNIAEHLKDRRIRWH